MARLSQGYVDDFGQEAVDRAAATATNDRKTNPALRRVKKQAPKASTPVTPGKGKVIVGKPVLMNAAPRAEAVTPPAPEPTYGGRPASELESASGSRIDEFHVSDQQLADMKKRLPVENTKKSEPEPLHESYARLNGKSVNEFSHSDLALADATNAMDKREGKVVPKENEVTQGQLTEASERDTVKSGKMAVAKEALEKGTKNEKIEVDPVPTSYVWDSKADKFGTRRGKRGIVKHVSEDQDDFIRAELTRKADLPPEPVGLGKGEFGRDGNKFERSTTDWQGKPADRADVLEAANIRAGRGPIPGTHNYDPNKTGGGPGTNRTQGKTERIAANAQARYDESADSPDRFEHPDVLAKEAQLAGTTIDDPKWKSKGHLHEDRARARIVVHGGVSEKAAMNLSGEGLIGVHDLVMNKKRFEEGRLGKKPYTYKGDEIKEGDLEETGRMVNGVKEERPVPKGRVFQRSAIEVPKGSGELVTKNSEDSDYTAGEIRPVHGHEGHVREQRKNADGSIRHVWVKRELPKNIIHAADEVVSHVNKFGRMSPRMAARNVAANRAKADEQNAVAGLTETPGIDKRNRYNRDGAETGANVTAAAVNQAQARSRANFAYDDRISASAIDEAEPTTSDSARSRATAMKIGDTLSDTFSGTRRKKGAIPVGKVKVEKVPVTGPSPEVKPTLPGVPAAAPKRSKQFTGATIPGTEGSARVALSTIDKPVAEGGTGRATEGVSLAGVPTLQTGEESGVDVSGGTKNPFARRLGDMDTAVVRTAGAPQVSEQFTRQDAMAALASAPVADKPKRTLVSRARKLTTEEAGLAKSVKDNDDKLLSSGQTRKQEARLRTLEPGTTVEHPIHGIGEVQSHDEDGVHVKFDNPINREGHRHVVGMNRNALKNLSAQTQVPNLRNQSQLDVAEPKEGVHEIPENKVDKQGNPKALDED